MTIRILTTLQITFSLLMFSGCEDPTRKADQAVPPGVEEGIVAEEVPAIELSKPLQLEPEKNVESKMKIEEVEEPEPVRPSFKIYKEGEKIVVEGALRSRIQVNRISERLAHVFPDSEIQYGLKRETHRHAVGWGNRIVPEMVEGYFTIVKSPSVEYKEGIITFSGNVSNVKDHKMATEMVINVFSGDWTLDYVNDIKVVGE